MQLNQHSLSDIQITCNHGHYIPIIMQYCHNITYLRRRIHYPNITLRDVEESWLSSLQGRCCKLRHLSVRIGHLINLSQTVFQIIPHCRELESLYYFCGLYPSDQGQAYQEGTMLEYLDQHCKESCVELTLRTNRGKIRANCIQRHAALTIFSLPALAQQTLLFRPFFDWLATCRL